MKIKYKKTVIFIAIIAVIVAVVLSQYKIYKLSNSNKIDLKTVERLIDSNNFDKIYKRDTEYKASIVGKLFVSLMTNHTVNKKKNLILMDTDSHEKRIESIKRIKIPGKDINYYSQAEGLKKTVESISNIYMPGDFLMGYNPSAIEYDDNYLLAYRWDRYTKDKQDSFIALALIDKEFKLKRKPQLLIDGLCSESKCKVEDPRIFNFKGDTYIVFNSDIHIKDELITLKREIKVAKLKNENGLFVVDKVIRMISPFEKQTEKNWAPLVFNDELYFIYSIEPQFIILKPNLNTGYSEVVVQKNSEANYQFGELRNTSAFIQLEQGKFMAFMHTHLPIQGHWYYFNFPAMLLCENGIKSCKLDVLDSPFAFDYAPYHECYNNLYISGFLSTDHKFIAFAGLNDSELLAIKITKNKLLNFFLGDKK